MSFLLEVLFTVASDALAALLNLIPKRLFGLPV